MHEMGVALQIIRIAVDSIPVDMGECEITAVNVEVGKTSALVPDSLLFCFNIAAENTPCSKAELVIKNVPTIMQCNNCSYKWEIEEMTFSCPECQGCELEIIKDCEIDIISIDVE